MAGIFQPMAFMVFNPYNTTPASTDFGIYPYEGNKILADFAAYGAANDDWIISPRLYFPDDFKLAFYARSFNYATPETIQVGYSETGYSPEDFIWVADKEVIDNSYWMEFSYDFPPLPNMWQYTASQTNVQYSCLTICVWDCLWSLNPDIMPQ